MGRDGSKKLKVAQIKPLRSGTLGCSHTSAPDARETGAFALFDRRKLPQCAEFAAGIAAVFRGMKTTGRDGFGCRPCRIEVLSNCHSPSSQLPSLPPMTPPKIGATQNSQTCESASPPAYSAGPRLRAGLTDVFEIGIDIR